jgi:hypothetical protein
MKTLLRLGLVLGIAGAPACFLLLRGPPFPEETIREYESLACPGDSGDDAPAGIPYRTGKVVLIRSSSWQVYRRGPLPSTRIPPQLEGSKEREIDPPRIDDSWFHLDRAIRAGEPGEASTLIVCTYGKMPVGEYLGIDNFSGPNASAKKAVRLKAIDLGTRGIIGEALLTEKHEKLDGRASGLYTGDPSEIAAFVAKIPLRGE